MRDDTRPHHRYGHRGQPHDPRQREPAQQHECSPKWVPTHISARSYALRTVRPATPLTSCSPSSPSALPLHGAVGVRDFSRGSAMPKETAMPIGPDAHGPHSTGGGPSTYAAAALISRSCRGGCIDIYHTCTCFYLLTGVCCIYNPHLYLRAMHVA